MKKLYFVIERGDYMHVHVDTLNARLLSPDEMWGMPPFVHKAVGEAIEAYKHDNTIGRYVSVQKNVFKKE